MYLSQLPSQPIEYSEYTDPNSYEVMASNISDRHAVRVTALVSTYNADRFFSGCIRDLMEQTLFKNGELEILVIDSHSPGREREYILELMKRHSNITYVRTKAREPLYRAWNRGVLLASGEFLTSANTDDRHRHDALSILSNALLNDPSCALAYGDFLVTRDENQTFEAASVHAFWHSYEFDRARQAHFGQNGCQPMWRRSLHQKYGLFNEVFEVCADFDWWLRLLNGEYFVHIPELLGLYLESPTSIEHRNPELAQSEFVIVRNEHCSRYGIEIDNTKYPARTMFPFFFRRHTCAYDEPRRATIIVTKPAWSQAEPILEAIYRCAGNSKYEVFLRGRSDIDVAKQFHRFSDKLRIRAFTDQFQGDTFFSTVMLGLNASTDLIHFVGDVGVDWKTKLDHVSKIMSEQGHDLYFDTSDNGCSEDWRDILHRTFLSTKVLDLVRQSSSVAEARNSLISIFSGLSQDFRDRVAEGAAVL